MVSRVLHSERLRPHLSSVYKMSLNGFKRRKIERHIILGVAQVISWHDELKIGLFMHEFAGCMPNLAVLELWNTNWDHCPPRPSAFMALSRFPSIRELTLVCCHFRASSALRRALTALPLLTALELRGVTWPQPNVELPFLANETGRKPLRMALSTLSMSWYIGTASAHDSRCAQQFVAWLSATSTPSSLRHLELELDPTDPEAGQGYIYYFGSMLPQFCRFVSTLSMRVLAHNSEGLSGCNSIGA